MSLAGGRGNTQQHSQSAAGGGGGLRDAGAGVQKQGLTLSVCFLRKSCCRKCFAAGLGRRSMSCGGRRGGRSAVRGLAEQVARRRVPRQGIQGTLGSGRLVPGASPGAGRARRAAVSRRPVAAGWRAAGRPSALGATLHPGHRLVPPPPPRCSGNWVGVVKGEQLASLHQAAQSQARWGRGRRHAGALPT